MFMILLITSFPQSKMSIQLLMVLQITSSPRKVLHTKVINIFVGLPTTYSNFSNYYGKLDNNGISWIVTSVPFFDAVDGSNSATFKSLIMLVFSRVDLAEAPLLDLNSQINTTSTSLAIVTILITVGCFIVLFGVLLVLVKLISGPLVEIQKIALSIIEVSAEDERYRNYSLLLSNVRFAILSNN